MGALKTERGEHRAAKFQRICHALNSALSDLVTVYNFRIPLFCSSRVVVLEVVILDRALKQGGPRNSLRGPLGKIFWEGHV